MLKINIFVLLGFIILPLIIGTACSSHDTKDESETNDASFFSRKFAYKSTNKNNNVPADYQLVVKPDPTTKAIERITLRFPSAFKRINSTKISLCKWNGSTCDESRPSKVNVKPVNTEGHTFVEIEPESELQMTIDRFAIRILGLVNPAQSGIHRIDLFAVSSQRENFEKFGEWLIQID